MTTKAFVAPVLVASLSWACSASTATRQVELSPTSAVTRTIAAGESQVYHAKARKGDLVRVVAVQRGADVKLRVRDGAGAIIREVDEPDAKYGTEQLTLVAPASGTYQVEVVGMGVAASGNTYDLTLSRKSGTTAADRLVVLGEEAYYGGLLLVQERGGGADRIREAVPLFEEAVKSYRAAGYRYGESRALTALAAAIDDLSDYAKGHPLILEAVAMQRADGDEAGLVRSLQELTWNTVNGREVRKALEIGREAIGLAEKLGLRDIEADLRNTVGIALRDLADREAAREALTRAAALFADVGDVIGEGRARANLAGVLQQTGQTKEAMALLQRSAELHRLGKSVEDEAYSLMSLGHLYMSQGDSEAAIAEYERARSLGERNQHPARVAQALHSLGVAYANRGEFARGLELTLQAHAIYVSVGDKFSGASAAQSSGRAYYHLGRFKDALEQYDRAMAVFQTMDSRLEDGRLFIFIGQVYEDLGDADRAREWYTKVLDSLGTASQASDEQDALIRLAALDVASGDHSAARGRLTRALSLAAKSGQTISEGDALLVLGDLERQAGNAPAALAHYAKARDYYARGRIRSRTAIATFRLGSATETARDFETARRFTWTPCRSRARRARPSSRGWPWGGSWRSMPPRAPAPPSSMASRPSTSTSSCAATSPRSSATPSGDSFRPRPTAIAT